MQQWQVIAYDLAEFHLLLGSQFRENALAGICQNRQETRPKFLAKILRLLAEFFQDLSDFLVLFER